MATSGSSRSAQERRAAQREALRKQRQAELKRQRNIRTIVISAVVVVALVVVGGAGFLIYRSTQPAAPVAAPTGVNEEQPYLPLGAPEDSGAPVVEVHLDFMCPHCATFEQVNGEDLSEMVANEEVTLQLVPRRFMDAHSSTGDYSTRAANALTAVYAENPDNVMQFQQLLFANQPQQGSDGLTDDQIFGYAQEAGASDAVRSDIDNGTYSSWVRDVVDPYAAENGGGTPYVEIDGTQFEDWGEPGNFRSAVESAGQAQASDGGGA